jgi:hypothetical protein
MKSLAFAAALLMGTAAIAQSTTPMMMPSTGNPSTSSLPGSEMTMPPSGKTNDGTTTASPAAATSPTPPAPAAQTSYPRCSANVTDECRQGSAREIDRRAGPHKRRG